MVVMILKEFLDKKIIPCKKWARIFILYCSNTGLYLKYVIFCEFFILFL